MYYAVAISPLCHQIFFIDKVFVLKNKLDRDQGLYLVGPWYLCRQMQICATQLVPEVVIGGHQDAHFQAPFAHHG